MNRGSSHWNAKLSDFHVLMIRQSKLPTRIIAGAFQINPRYVRKLRARHVRKVITL